MKVLVTEIDRQGRVNLSRRALLEPAENGQEGGEVAMSDDGDDRAIGAARSASAADAMATGADAAGRRRLSDRRSWSAARAATRPGPRREAPTSGRQQPTGQRGAAGPAQRAQRSAARPGRRPPGAPMNTGGEERPVTEIVRVIVAGATGRVGSGL